MRDRTIRIWRLMFACWFSEWVWRPHLTRTEPWGRCAGDTTLQWFCFGLRWFWKRRLVERLCEDCGREFKAVYGATTHLWCESCSGRRWLAMLRSKP